MDADRRTMASGVTCTYEEIVTTTDARKATFLASKGPVFDAAGKVVGLFGISRDITEHKRTEDLVQAALGENEKLVVELRDALAHVKTLRDMLPVCAWCRKIRSDDGYWKQLETYLAENVQVRVSHSICPDCYAKFGYR